MLCVSCAFIRHFLVFRYDLFAEMVMIGQMLNYQEFYQRDIVDLMLLWQDTTGCYNDESLATDAVNNITKYVLPGLLLCTGVVTGVCNGVPHVLYV